jgi:hypothetical protein
MEFFPRYRDAVLSVSVRSAPASPRSMRSPVAYPMAGGLNSTLHFLGQFLIPMSVLACC